MKENEKAIFEPSERMDGMQDVVYMVEAFLSENYRFRRNILSGKTELAPARCRKGHEPKWKPVTAEEVNSIVRRAKKACVGGKRSPKVEIEEYIYSNDIPAFNPIREYLSSLPEWDDRVRYASFLATTNDLHPLCDTTGSRRYLCLRIRNGMFIDNHSPINYAQLYAQVKHELLDEKVPYWFTADEVSRIQTSNLPFLRTDDMESILHQCFRLPRKKDEGVWLTCKQVGEALLKVCPSMRRGNSTNIRIGQTLKYLGCQMKHTYKGSAYRLIEIAQ